MKATIKNILEETKKVAKHQINIGNAPQWIDYYVFNNQREYDNALSWHTDALTMCAKSFAPISPNFEELSATEKELIEYIDDDEAELEYKIAFLNSEELQDSIYANTSIDPIKDLGYDETDGEIFIAILKE